MSDGHRHTDGPAVSADGRIFFTDVPNNRIHAVGPDGKVSVFSENTSGANGMMFGPDGRLYAGLTRSKQLVAYDAAGAAQVLAEDVTINDLAINVKGDIYLTDSANKKVWFLPKGGKPRVVGSLAHKQRYFYVHMPDAATRSAADGMAVDTDGRVYIATSLGVQVFDQIGKCTPSFRRRGARRSRTSSSAAPASTRLKHRSPR